MVKLHQISLSDLLAECPEIELFNPDQEKAFHYDFFLCALGFEERTLAMPAALSPNSAFKFDETVYFQYETSTAENAYNEPKLLEYFKKMGKKRYKLFCDEPNFTTLLSEAIARKMYERKDGQLVKVMFDISVCSSKLILSVIKLLINLDIELTIVYTEAKIYYPLYTDYIKNQKAF